MTMVHRHYQMCSCRNAPVRRARVLQKVPRVEENRGDGKVHVQVACRSLEPRSSSLRLSLPCHCNEDSTKEFNDKPFSRSLRSRVVHLLCQRPVESSFESTSITKARVRMTSPLSVSLSQIQPSQDVCRSSTSARECNILSI